MNINLLLGSKQTSVIRYIRQTDIQHTPDCDEERPKQIIETRADGDGAVAAAPKDTRRAVPGTIPTRLVFKPPPPPGGGAGQRCQHPPNGPPPPT